ncbi:MAG: hypothetical protein LBH06_06620 [Rikenellaceae bacterium]|jgi:hypothetical protein|nr:hypothetical protein [Rikenellaceae bacterium]
MLIIAGTVCSPVYTVAAIPAGDAAIALTSGKNDKGGDKQGYKQNPFRIDILSNLLPL